MRELYEVSTGERILSIESLFKKYSVHVSRTLVHELIDAIDECIDDAYESGYNDGCDAGYDN